MSIMDKHKFYIDNHTNITRVIYKHAKKQGQSPGMFLTRFPEVGAVADLKGLTMVELVDRFNRLLGYGAPFIHHFKEEQAAMVDVYNRLL